jgi:hypothetical protein
MLSEPVHPTNPVLGYMFVTKATKKRSSRYVNPRRSRSIESSAKPRAAVLLFVRSTAGIARNDHPQGSSTRINSAHGDLICLCLTPCYPEASALKTLAFQSMLILCFYMASYSYHFAGTPHLWPCAAGATRVLGVPSSAAAICLC